MELRSIHSNLHHLCRKTHIILTWIYSICITFINFVLNFNPIIVTPVGHLITDPKKIRDILNILLYTGTNFEDLSRKHIQIIPACIRKN